MSFEPLIELSKPRKIDEGYIKKMLKIAEGLKNSYKKYKNDRRK